jgi:probable HAF family extracellular repeat protein
MKNSLSLLVSLISLYGSCLLAGCGSGSAAPPPPPLAITVDLTPNSAQALDVNQNLPVTANVNNDSSSEGVSWTITCPAGVNNCGAMAQAKSASGAQNKFIAPANVSAAETLNVTATSVSDPTKFRSVSVSINPALALINPPPAQPQPGIVGQPFSLNLMTFVQGGSSPLIWAIKSGTLPGGLTLNANTGMVTGTPSSAATAAIVAFNCTDAGNPPTALAASFEISFMINPAGPLTITNGAPPSGTVGAAYGGTQSSIVDHALFTYAGWPLAATGGAPAYHWSWSAAQGSSLPPGLAVTVLTLTSGGSTRCCVTAQFPVIAGRPTSAGTYHVIATVTDSGSPAANASASYTITISSASTAAASAMIAPSSRENYTHYELIDLGTLGGPNSNTALPFFNGVVAPSLSHKGTFVGQADTSTPDPFSPNCFNFECYVSHAIKWEEGVRTDLGALPGPAGLSSAPTWISDNGLIAGFSENGEVDPFTGIQSVHSVVWKHDGIFDLGTLKGGYESIANAVNNQGEVVGYANNGIIDSQSMVGFGSQTRAVAWWNGEIHDLGTLGGTDAVALYVNDLGQIVGQSYTSSSVPPPTPECGDFPLTLHAFIWENGQMTDLRTLGGLCASAFALNNRGQVVGGATIPGDTESHAFLWERGVMKDLGALGGTHSYAGWLNDSGRVVGSATNSGDQALLAFSWKDGAITNLGTLNGDACSAADAINSKDQVVGGSGFYDASFFPACTDAVEHAVLWEDGKILDLNSVVSAPDLTLNEATFINDRGEISGFATLANGDTHAFVLIPCDADHPDLEEDCDSKRAEVATEVQLQLEQVTRTEPAHPAKFSPAEVIARFRSSTAVRKRRYGIPQASPK